jgi:hypothetical protein
LTLERAAAIVREALVDRRYGETPLGEHVVAYLDALEYADSSLNTLLAYEHVLGLFAVEHADLTLDELEPPRGGGVVRAFLDRHWQTSSASTRRQRLAILRSFLTWLVGEGLLSANATVNIKPPKVSARRATFSHGRTSMRWSRRSLRYVTRSRSPCSYGSDFARKNFGAFASAT